jgi:hypothetical protein
VIAAASGPEENAVGVIAAEENVVDGIVADAGVSLVARVDVSRVRVNRRVGISGWTRCASGLRRVVLGRVRQTMKLWI